MENSTPMKDPNEPNYLTAEEILSIPDVEYKDVEVPEWSKDGRPGIITLRSMSAAEALAYAEDKDKHGGVVAIAMSAWDKRNNRPLFSKSQVELLKTKRNKVFQLLQREVMKLNGWRTQAEREAEAEAAKNA